MTTDSPEVTIVIPNWNTGPLLRVCLASLVKFTRVPHRIVVVDNASDDASRHTAEGAEELGLIDLIRRDDAKNDGAAEHGAALDAGLQATETPLLMTLDSDAWARRSGWLGVYREALGTECSHAGATKFPGGRIKRFSSWLRGKQTPPEARYVRPCHALYRVGRLREHELSFAPVEGADGRWRTTGERIHERLVDLGHEPALMAHSLVEAQVGHLRHATFVINAARFPTLRRRAQRRGEIQIRRLLASAETRGILKDTPIP